MSLNIQGDDFNAPTNPQLISTTADFSDGDRVYTAITSHGGVSVSISGWGGSIAENSNLSTTKGFRLKCYDALTTTGISFNPTEQNLIDNDYFVLLYSDKPFEHHFAKITEIKTEDEYGDAFEFTPKLGNEIVKDTKFIIFEVAKDSDIIAISLGMLQDNSADLENELARRMVVARPLFYFYDGLDKEGELNHNVKYYAMRECGTANSYTLDNTDPSRTFVTVQDFGKTIIDYSKYSHSITLTDELRTLDETNTATNEGSTGLASDTTDYNACYRNARRIGDDVITTPVYTGPNRYLHYDFSPTKSNILYNVYDHFNTESIGGKGGFSETSVIDNGRILRRKIQEFYAYRVRQNIHRGSVNDFFALKATYSSNSGNVYTFDTEYDLEDVLNDGDEIRLGNNIFIIEDLGSLSGNTQDITVENDGTDPYTRAENNDAFTAQSTTPSSGEVLHRRAYNASDGTLMLDTHLLNGRFSKMYVAFTSLNHNERFATITACDAVKGMITLSFTGESYNSNSLSFVNGQYQLFIERFNGEIEDITNRKDNGQTIVEIKGRDKFSKLLSPVVNLNTLFTEDIIYSSNSPYNKLVLMDGNNFTIALGDTSLDTGLTFSQFTNLPAVGDHLFTVNGYIGEVTSRSVNGSLEYTLGFSKEALTEANSEQIYVSKEKNYILTKALSSSHLTENKPSSLTGSANKGLIFTSGNKISSDGTKSETLVSSSANTSEGSVGYAINSPSSIHNEFAFQTKLTDEQGGADAASFDTVNTLIDFEVISTNRKDNTTQIEIAPYIPITLGRLSDYHNDFSDYTFVDLGTAGTSTSEKVNVTNTNAHTLNKGDPIFVRTGTTGSFVYTFIGNVLKININTKSTTSVDVFLDRNTHGLTITGETIVSASKSNTHLSVVNSAHLWGGKILIHPHPQVKTEGAVPLNIENTTGSGDFNAKFGQMYYRFYDKAVGNFGVNKPLISNGFDRYPHYYTGKHNLSYLMTGYKFKPNTSTNNTVDFGKTDSSHRVLPLDIRGKTGPFGYNTHNSRIHMDLKDVFPLDDDIIETEGKLIDCDVSALRLFLYINGDLLPYSSLRTDSLLHSSSGAMTKTLENYNLLLIENNNVVDNSVISGKRTSLKDSNFQKISFNSNKDLSTLKRFGLMRLTEVCFDFHFNPVNPEQPITQKYENNTAVNLHNYEVHKIVDSGNTALTGTFIDGGGSPSVTFSANPSPALVAGDKIYDRFGRFIAEISTTSSGNVYNLSALPNRTENGSLPSSSQDLYHITTDSTTVNVLGRNEADTSFQLESHALHPLKAALLPESSHYGEDASDKIRVRNNDSDVHVSDQEIYAPIVLDGGTANVSAKMTLRENFSSRVLRDVGTNKNPHKGMIGVSLDRFDIENGAKYPLVEGNTTQVFTGDTNTTVLETRTGSNRDTHFILTAAKNYKELANIDDTSATEANAESESKKAADGTFMVFKPRLWYSSSVASQSYIKSSNGNVVKTEFTIGTSNNFLKFIDLTGCYLVQERGTNINGSSVVSGTETNRKSMNNVSASFMTYVISHEVDESNSSIHHLVTDTGFITNSGYRILQPNEVCMYDFTPNKIYMNTLSSSYTKLANKNEMYNIQSGYFHREGTTKEHNIDTEDEGVLSMYIFIDTDEQSSSNSSIVVRGANDFLTEALEVGNHILYASDGDNKQKLNIDVELYNEFEARMVLSKTFFAKGIVSFSEPFTVSSNQILKINPNRACIGSTVSLGLEGEDLINELLEQEGIEFQTTGTNVPLYLAPNYQGVDLYSAIRYVLDRKEMKLVEENNVFKIVPENDDSYYTNITIDDSGDYLISEFEKVSTLFDFYNEINVYGQEHKATRKDLRSMQKRGRKTLEVVDNTLITQEEVDKKATKLLRTHSKLNEKLTFTMQNKGINQLRVGDVVNVNIPRENIEFGEYIVLEMEHRLTGFTKLQLGRYSKDLSDIFSELLISSKETKSALRSSNLNNNEVSYNFLETLKTKELKLLVRKREATGDASTLGFGFTFNVNTTAFGFTSGQGILITNLVEEDLA